MDGSTLSCKSALQPFDLWFKGRTVEAFLVAIARAHQFDDDAWELLHSLDKQAFLAAVLQIMTLHEPAQARALTSFEGHLAGSMKKPLLEALRIAVKDGIAFDRDPLFNFSENCARHPNAITAWGELVKELSRMERN